MAEKGLPASLRGQLDVLMIDNFDSFTWNLYQSLCLLGAQVTVVRNDAISPAHFPQIKIKSLIISPGPGHPKTDSGVSNAAIEYFQGKIPVLGVCMGLECLVDLHGGKIGYAGEIMHGKVSRIRHDGRGCFKDIQQGIKSTRYHSLSASITTIPEVLSITATTQESGVIMGLRHRKFTTEAVQYHPESIMSEGGQALLKNFLELKGGTWDANPEARVLDPDLPPFPTEILPSSVASNDVVTSKAPSILEKIYAQRLVDVSKAQQTPGSTLADLETLLALNIAPPLISFIDRLKESGDKIALLAEIKRASPSKGPIAVDTSPPAQALAYALAGANVISVLTEPHWFLGTLQDMYHARMSVAHLVNRPAILRKDFILSKYQILEARLYGADTVLLIVSMLPEELLQELYAFSLSLGMEPLVEVNNAREMEMALSLQAKVVGVNNRNLHSFDVDMGTTSRLREMVKGQDVILIALSGISTRDDVEKYAQEGVQAVLIGESLMRAKDTAAFIRQLFSIPEPLSQEPGWRTTSPLIKICGIRNKDEALAVAASGADLLGLVFVEGSRRKIDLETAKVISYAIRGSRFSQSEAAVPIDTANTPWFTTHATRLSSGGNGPLLVGVFQNATLAEVLHAVSYVQLDIVQLHGAEPAAWAHQIPVPVIRAFHIGPDNSGLKDITRPGIHQFILLDSMRDDGSGVSGGSGKVLDLELAKRVVDAGEFVVDGGKAYEAPAATKAEVESAKLPSQQAPAPDGEAPQLVRHETPQPMVNEPIVNGASPAPTASPTPAASPAPATPAAVSTSTINGDGATNDTTVNDKTTLAPAASKAFARFPLPVILAGGLTAENVSVAIATVHPWAVDVSGGVENPEGTSKDIEKVQQFITSVRGVVAEPESEA